MTMPHLYHGSTTQNIRTLEPRKRYTPQGKIEYAAIYATPVAGYAACHSFPWSTDEGVNLNTFGGKFEMSVPVALKERLQEPISIYKIPDTGFTHTKEETTGYTWHTIQPVEVLEEVKYESVEKALQELGVKLSYI